MKGSLAYFVTLLGAVSYHLGTGCATGTAFLRRSRYSSSSSRSLCSLCSSLTRSISFSLSLLPISNSSRWAARLSELLGAPDTGIVGRKNDVCLLDELVSRGFPFDPPETLRVPDAESKGWGRSSRPSERLNLSRVAKVKLHGFDAKGT